MAKSIEPEVKDWFAQALSQHKTKYCIEQGTLNIEIENRSLCRTSIIPFSEESFSKIFSIMFSGVASAMKSKILAFRLLS